MIDQRPEAEWNVAECHGKPSSNKRSAILASVLSRRYFHRRIWPT